MKAITERITAVGAVIVGFLGAAAELWRVYVGTIAGILRGFSRKHRRGRNRGAGRGTAWPRRPRPLVCGRRESRPVVLDRCPSG